MVGDFALLDTHDVNRLEMDFSVSWSDAKKGPFVSAVVRLVRSHPVTVGKLPVDLRMKVGKCSANIPVEFSYACLVWSSVRLRRGTDEIFREEFVEDVKSSLSLELLSIPADHGFFGFLGTSVSHLFSFFSCQVFPPFLSSEFVSDSILTFSRTAPRVCLVPKRAILDPILRNSFSATDHQIPKRSVRQ